MVFPFLLTLGWMALEDTRKQRVQSVPFVSIVIPAYNEEASILRSLDALNRLDYPSFEVIVVNDGSTDFTFSVIESARVKCIHLKKNQGKADPEILSRACSNVSTPTCRFQPTQSRATPAAISLRLPM